MKGIPEDRALMLGQYIVDHGATVRSTAAAFGFSKSLVHKDVTERLSRRVRNCGRVSMPY